MSEAAVSLLDSPRYRRFLAEAHPELQFCDERLAVPSFIGPLDVREPLLPGPLRAALLQFPALLEAPLRPTTLFLGTPFEPYDQTHLFENVHDVSALASSARAAALERGLDLVVVTCVSPDAPFLGAWRREGFVTLQSFPDAVVTLRGRSFDEHLMTLAGEDRGGIRRNLRRFSSAGLRLERGASNLLDGRSLFAAYEPMLERATVKWFPHSRAYFEGIAALGDEVCLTVARDERARALGFILCFNEPMRRDGRRLLHAGRIGVLPEVYRRHGVYFRLLYSVLEEGFRVGATHVSLEPTAYRTKRHLGARRKRTVNLVLGVSPLWRMLLGTCGGLGRRLLRHLDHRRTLERVY